MLKKCVNCGSRLLFPIIQYQDTEHHLFNRIFVLQNQLFNTTKKQQKNNVDNKTNPPSSSPAAFIGPL